LCGDGIVVAGKEGCDDKNSKKGDGCTNCKVENNFVCKG
jgi:cysteine-rich repeat protein